MSKFMEVYVSESWRTIIDHLPIGQYFNDKINDGVINKFMHDPHIKAILLKGAKDILAEAKKSAKGYTVTHEIPDNIDINRRANDDFSYLRKIDKYTFIVVTDGEHVKSVHFFYWLTRKKDGEGFYEYQSIIAKEE